MKKLTKDQKMKVVANCDELKKAVGIMASLMDDIKAKNCVCFEFTDKNGKQYVLQLLKLHNPL